MTLKEIAQEAGVSIMTVSNVINGKHDRVSKKTIKNIQEIIKKYNYIPNLSARSLAAKSSHIVMVIIPIIENSNPNIFYTPYISDLLGIMESELRESGYFLMIRSTSTLEDLEIIFKNWNADGAIFLLPNFEDALDDLLKITDIPMVFLDSYSTNPNILNVRCDDRKGSYLSTKYLINNGHRNIAFAADFKRHLVLQERYNGYCDALSEGNIPINPDYIFSIVPDYEHGVELGRKIADMNKIITGVVTTSDFCAVGLMEGARLGGLRLPSELSIIGFDDLQFSTFTVPKLTTISQHLSKKAAAAARLLLHKMNHDEIASRNIIIDVELIERQSVVSAL